MHLVVWWCRRQGLKEATLNSQCRFYAAFYMQHESLLRLVAADTAFHHSGGYIPLVQVSPLFIAMKIQHCLHRVWKPVATYIVVLDKTHDVAKRASLLQPSQNCW